MTDTLIQIGIAVCGLGSLLLINYGRWQGWCLGLVGQVFWIPYAIRTRTWGIGLLVAAYTVTWALGVRRHALPKIRAAIFFARASFPRWHFSIWRLSVQRWNDWKWSLTLGDSVTLLTIHVGPLEVFISRRFPR